MIDTLPAMPSLHQQVAESAGCTNCAPERAAPGSANAQNAQNKHETSRVLSLLQKTQDKYPRAFWVVLVLSEKLAKVEGQLSPPADGK